MKKTPIVLGLGALALGVVGFLALPGGRGWLTSTGVLGEERLVRSRIDGYWNARVQGDLAAMARYQHPDQQSVPDTGLLTTEAFEIRSLSIEGDQATAEVAVKARLQHPKLRNMEREVVAKERWVKVDGRWHRDKQLTSIKDMFRGVQDRLHPSGDTAPDGQGGPGSGGAGGREEVTQDDNS
jgi:hypothetical protein